MKYAGERGEKNSQHYPGRCCSSPRYAQADRAEPGGQFPFDRPMKFYDFSDINQAIGDAKHGHAIKPLLRTRGAKA
jgi:hypothetical protein